MILFAVAATISFGAFFDIDSLRRLPFWGPAVVIFALSIGREPSVIFLALFLLPTMILGIAALFRRMSPTPFLIFALSDITLAIAFSIYQSKTALWTLPEVGQWGPAAAVTAVAAVLRLGGAAAVADPREGGMVALGWWQGAMLAYWAGAPAVAVLVAGAILLWAAAAYYPQSGLSGLTLAGGVVALTAGLGGGLLGVLSVGLAGTALVLGDRLVSAWAVGILPLSLVTTLSIPGGPFAALPALLFPGAWAVMSGGLSAIKPAAERLDVVGGSAAVVAVAYAAALVENIVSGGAQAGPGLGGLPVPAAGALWLLYGAGLAGAAVTAVAGSPQAGQQPVRFELAAGHSPFDDLLSKLIPAVGWFCFAVAVAVTLRLLIAGFGTGFL